MNSHTSFYSYFGLVLLLLPGSLCAEQKWELGATGGYAFATDGRISNASGEASAGLKPGPTFSFFAGNHVRSWLSGEARYSYRLGDLSLSGAGGNARFGSESHLVHYDLLFQAGRPSGIQPFVAVGGGIRVYRGTGQESRSQVLNRFAILSKTTDMRPLLSIGGGVRIPVSHLVTIRLEIRDFATPFPSEVIAPLPGATASGWLHDFTPMVGIGFRF